MILYFILKKSKLETAEWMNIGGLEDWQRQKICFANLRYRGMEVWKRQNGKKTIRN